MTQTQQRWMVIDNNGTRIVTGMLRKENAQNEADMLNVEGLEEFRPYTVTEDVMAEEFGFEQKRWES